MIHPSLFSPKNIAVIGGSDNKKKPGGKVLFNLLEGDFNGNIYAVNPKKIEIPGIVCCLNLDDLPEVDLAILAVPADHCLEAISKLSQKGVRAYIIYSAGFGEAGHEGKIREEKLSEIARKQGLSIVGPNCIGIINHTFKGVFTSPIPQYYADGCEIVSSSGATAVFLMEAAFSTGLRFSNVYSIGNGQQIGMEEMLEYMDEHFDPVHSPRTKLLYMENIRNPFKFLKHCSSLIRKGCHIAAIKSGSSIAGSRAASSHTGAISTSDTLVRALFKKAGVVYCSGREELISLACVWQIGKPLGKNAAIITHAGGSAVMLTDTLSQLGMQVPPIPEALTTPLLEKLNPGSSAANPIDFLATGSAQQLGEIIDFCERLDFIDVMVVVFGSPGLFQVGDVYELLHHKLITSTKAIFPVLPSLVNAQVEIQEFVNKGHVNFPDEVVLGKALAHAVTINSPTFGNKEIANMDFGAIRDLISEAGDGYMTPEQAGKLLTTAGIPLVKECIIRMGEKHKIFELEFQFPVVAKIIGPIHKSDMNGVSLNIRDMEWLQEECGRLLNLPGAEGVLIQEQLSGPEFFAGAVKESNYGHLIVAGLGGTWVEILRDLSFGMAPVSKQEAIEMLKALKSYPVIQGYRGKPGVNEDAYADIIVRLSSLVYLAPEITAIDLNPIIGDSRGLTSVDYRVCLKK